MGERGIKRLITVFAEAMSRVASRQSRVSQAKGDDTKADGEIKKRLITVFAEAMSAECERNEASVSSRSFTTHERTGQ